MSERADVVQGAAALATPTSPASIVQVRQAYFAIVLLVCGIVAWGFWKNFYSQLPAPHLPAMVRLHAAVFTGWVVLLVAQAATVVAGNVGLHRRFGVAGMVYGAAVFAVGVLVSVGAPALRVRAAQFSLEVGGLVVLYNLMDMLLFGAFLWLAFRYRSRSELHKRWIVAATAALCGAALGRVVPGGTLQYLLLWLSPLIAMAAVDLVTLRRVHFVSLVGSSLLVVSFFKVPLLAAPIWSDIGAALLRPFV